MTQGVVNPAGDGLGLPHQQPITHATTDRQGVTDGPCALVEVPFISLKVGQETQRQALGP